MTTNTTPIHAPAISSGDHVTVVTGRGRKISGVFRSWDQPQRGFGVFVMFEDGDSQRTLAVSLSPAINPRQVQAQHYVEFLPGTTVVREDRPHPSQIGQCSATDEMTELRQLAAAVR